jgi:membrane-associated phospholipid phosphatase
MSSETTDAGSETVASLVLPRADGRRASEHAAWLVSQIASPPAAALLVILFAAARENTSSSYGFAAVHAALVVLAPLSYLLALLRSGAVSDLDIYRREERRRPFLATVTGAWIAWGLLRAGGAPVELTGAAGVLAVEVALVFAITLGWKISLHCATLAVVSAVLWKLTGTTAPLVIGIPLMIWSRLTLRRHTPAQTVAGALLGILVVMWSFDLFAGRS